MINESGQSIMGSSQKSDEKMPFSPDHVKPDIQIGGLDSNNVKISGELDRNSAGSSNKFMRVRSRLSKISSMRLDNFADLKKSSSHLGLDIKNSKDEGIEGINDSAAKHPSDDENAKEEDKNEGMPLESNGGRQVSISGYEPPEYSDLDNSVDDMFASERDDGSDRSYEEEKK